MMKMIAAIRAIMRAVSRAMSAMIRVTIRVGDRLISVLVPRPMPAIDELEPPAPTEVDHARAHGEEAAIRNLAAAMLHGAVPAPEMFAAVGEKVSEWLMVLSPDMLKRVVTATNAELHDHLRGRKTIRGLLYFDEETVGEFRVAGLRQRAREMQAALVSPRYA
jgi:hypothetical protein